MLSEEIKSLEVLCVDYILDNLDGFCAVYNSDKSEANRARFQLLQSIYSETLIANSRGKLRLKDEHVPLLINRHIKSLDMEDFSSCSWKIVKKRLLKCGDVLNHLRLIRHFCDCSHLNSGKQNDCWGYSYTIYPWKSKIFGFPTQWVMSNNRPYFLKLYEPQRPEYCCRKKKISSHSLKNALSRLKNIQMLNLKDAKVNDDMIRVIGNFCSHLRSLDVSHCRSVTDKGLEYLFRVKRKVVLPRCALQHLNVLETGVTDKGIEYVLKNMPLIETLTHERTALVLYDMHKTDLHNDTLDRSKNYNLVNLHIETNSLIFESNVLVICSAVCPSLRRLDISYSSKVMLDEMNTASKITLHTIAEQCCKFDCLTSLRLNGNYEISIDSFLEQKGHRLLELDLLYFKVSLGYIARMCPNLEALSLFSICFTDTKWTNFSSVEHLKALSLYYLPYDFESAHKTKAITAFLSTSCPNLETLRLVWCPHLYYSEIHSEIEESILCCSTRLKELDLRYSQFYKPSFLKSIILSFPTLKTLDIRDCRRPDWIDDLLATLHSEKSSISLIWGYYIDVSLYVERIETYASGRTGQFFVRELESEFFENYQPRLKSK